MIIVPIQGKENIHLGHKALYEYASSKGLCKFFITYPLYEIKKILTHQSFSIVDTNPNRFHQLKQFLEKNQYDYEIASFSNHLFIIPEFDEVFSKFFPFPETSLFWEKISLGLKSHLLGLYNPPEYTSMVRGPELLNFFLKFVDSLKEIEVDIFPIFISNEFGIPYQSDLDEINAEDQYKASKLFSLFKDIAIYNKNQLNQVLPRYNIKPLKISEVLYVEKGDVIWFDDYYFSMIFDSKKRFTISHYFKSIPNLNEIQKTFLECIINPSNLITRRR